MERERLLEEYKVVLESLVEKIKFCYSEEFHKLDDFDKQKYQKDKMTTEAHLSTLCEILWGKKFQVDNGLGSLFALGLIGSMFNGGIGSPLPSIESLKETLEKNKKDKEEEERKPIYTLPQKEE